MSKFGASGWMVLSIMASGSQRRDRLKAKYETKMPRASMGLSLKSAEDLGTEI